MFSKPSHYLDNAAGRYAAFIENVPVVLYRETIEGKIVFCNKAFSSLFGFPSSQALINYPIIQLYRNSKDRGILVQAILNSGQVVDLPLPFVRDDGISLWCSVTARAVFDEEGSVVFIDGVLRDISSDIEQVADKPYQTEIADSFDEILLVFSLQGDVIDVNDVGVVLFGFTKKEMIGKSLFDLVVSRNRELFLLFLSDILKTGQEEGILIFQDRNHHEHHLEINATLVKKDNLAVRIKAIARDVTQKLKNQRKRLSEEKFRGVLEMAGGVAHQLNQPLTIINNLLGEIETELNAEGKFLRKFLEVNNQIRKLNEITRKISSIKSYVPMDYVAGIKIVDIDKASLPARRGDAND